MSVTPEMRTSMELERALARGDVVAARRALGDPDDWPNSRDPYLHDRVLAVAIGCARLETIRTLLREGADPNLIGLDDGFPALIDVLHHRRNDRPELRRWGDRHPLLAELLARGADVHARGLNDWTALHFAVADDDWVSVWMLLRAGADPDARTRIDDLETPRDIAVNHDRRRALAALREWDRGRA
jgi:ankyrin repeat protein